MSKLIIAKGNKTGGLALITYDKKYLIRCHQTFLILLILMISEAMVMTADLFAKLYRFISVRIRKPLD